MKVSKCSGILPTFYITYDDKRNLSYLICALATVFGTVIYAMIAAHKFGALGEAGCLSLSYVYNMELPLLTVLLLVYYTAACAFFWGIHKEQSQYVLPFFCLLVATIGFIGHAHIERMLFEVNEDERRFVVLAFTFTSAVLVFASAITLLLYREMSNLQRNKVEFCELFASEAKL